MSHELHDHDHTQTQTPDHSHERGQGRQAQDHEHGEDPTGVIARFMHAASELFGGHSHDSADQIDDALEANAAGRRALWVSLAGLMVTALIQLAVVILSGSVALLGDTVHNFADALTAGPLLVAFGLAARAPSSRLTYGYGRAEDLAGLFVVLMILLSTVFAAVESVRRFLNPQSVDHLSLVGAAAVVGFIGNELVARYRIRVGRQIGSAALVADGLHARTDGFISVAVLLGVGGVALGWNWADPVIGLAITVVLVGVLRSAFLQVGARLMDAVDPLLVDQAIHAISTVDGITAVEEVRIRWIGHTLRAEASVSVEADISVSEGHDIAHHAEQHLLACVPRLGGVTIHVSPVGAH